MEIQKIKTLLSSLSVNESISVLAEKSDINGVINILDNNYKVMTISKGVYSVARLADIRQRKTVDLSNSINKLTYFNTVNVTGEISYIRSLVSQYNMANDTKIKVKKYNNKAVIYKNVRDIHGPLTMHQMNEIKSELHELLFPLFDGVQLGELIEKPMSEQNIEEII